LESTEISRMLLLLGVHAGVHNEVDVLVMLLLGHVGVDGTVIVPFLLGAGWGRQSRRAPSPRLPGGGCTVCCCGGQCADDWSRGVSEDRKRENRTTLK
jgi:hypothetical protein